MRTGPCGQRRRSANGASQVFREDVEAARPERQRCDACDGREWQRPVKMREQGTTARRLVFERRLKAGLVDRHQEQIVLPGEMPRSGLAHLCGGREMDEAVGVIDRRAVEAADPLGLLPQGTGDNLVDQRHGDEMSWKRRERRTDVRPPIAIGWKKRPKAGNSRGTGIYTVQKAAKGKFSLPAYPRWDGGE